ASSTSPVPTTLRSGGSVAIVAEEGSITGHGVQIAAGFDASGNPVATTDPSVGNILLSAGEEIALYSAQGSSSTGFSATSSGAGFGIDLGTGLPVASGSHATGEGDGTGVYNLNSHVTGTGTVVINSGADTVLKGAVVSGETVIANVGGDLKIESVQDTAAYDEKSLGISAGFGPSGLSGGVNKGTVTGDFANVGEQSGIVAGSGGYHVAVEGGVDLIGGVIASTDTTGNSSLSADHLTFSDLENRSSASTSNIGLSASLPLSGSDAANAPLDGLAISPAVGQPAMESDGGTARATLTPGTLSLSNQTQDLASLNTNLSKANTQVEIYDIEELKAKQRNAAALSELLNIGVGTLSEKLGFDEGSPEKVALHAAVGALTAELAGGNAATGALAGGASEIANGVLAKVLAANPNLNEAQKAAITQWVAAAVGAAVGGELGAATALDNVNYNYLYHSEQLAREKAKQQLAKCKSDGGCDEGQVASLEEQIGYWDNLDSQRDQVLVGACNADRTSDACLAAVADALRAVEYLRNPADPSADPSSVLPGGYTDMEMRLVNGRFGGLSNQELATAVYAERLQTIALLSQYADSVQTALHDEANRQLVNAATAVVTFGIAQKVMSKTSRGQSATSTESGSSGASTGRAIEFDGQFYSADGFKFSKSYYEYLYKNGRPAPFIQAREVLSSNPKVMPDPRGAAGYFRYEGAGLEMIYNPTTGQVGHIKPLR
ncbi:hemagglutinin repeat-containing protein, partial [Ciceribacter sp. RN22]|uniref:hemagglutinin repeat-containing protein n=1 Tax=Ciceribacter sp. RN22 TaxID=2954932 RepID=UPI002093B408